MASLTEDAWRKAVVEALSPQEILELVGPQVPDRPKLERAFDPYIPPAFQRGLRIGGASIDKLGENTGMLARRLSETLGPGAGYGVLEGATQLEDFYRQRAQETMAAAPPAGDTYVEKAGEAIGAAIPGLALAAATGGASLLLAGIGALGAADRGPKEAAKAAAVNAAMGYILGQTGNQPPAIRVPIAGWTSTAADLIAGERDPVKIATNALIFGGLSAINPTRRPVDVETRAQLDVLAKEVPVVPERPTGLQPGVRPGQVQQEAGPIGEPAVPAVGRGAPGEARPELAQPQLEPPGAPVGGAGGGARQATAEPLFRAPEPVEGPLAQRLLTEEVAAAPRELQPLSSERGAIGGERPPRAEPTTEQRVQQADLVQKVRTEIDARVASGESLEQATAGHLNLSKFPDDPAGTRRATMQVIADMYKGEIAAQRRGEVPYDQIVQEAAAQFGVQGEANVREWLARTPGMNAKSPADLFAMNMYTQALTERVYKLGERIRAGDDSALMKADLVDAMHQLGEMQAATSGAQAETARSLGVLRRVREASQSAKDLADRLNQLGPEANVDRMLEAIDDARAARERGDVAGATALLAAGRRPTTVDELITLTQALTISSPTTQAVNAASNLAMATWAVGERAAAGASGSVRKGLSKAVGERGRLLTKVDKDRIALGESTELALGGMEAVTDLLRSISNPSKASTIEELRAAAGGGADVSTSALEQARLRAQMRPPWEGGASSKYQEQGMAGSTGTLRKIEELPFWGLGIGDATFRAVADRGGLYAAARREAVAQGLKGIEKEKWIVERVDQSVRNRALTGRPDKIAEDAEAFAAEQVLQSPLPPTTKKMSDAIGRAQGLTGLGARTLFLFRNTLANASRWAGRRTPVIGQLASDPTLKALAGKSGGKEFDLAMGRLTTGAAAAAAIFYAANSDVGGARLIGGFDEQKRGLKSALQTSGRQEYSIEWPDGTVTPFEQFAPVSTIVATVLDANAAYERAQTQEAQDQVLDVGTLAALSLAHQMTDQSFARNFASFMAAVSDPERAGLAFRNNLARTPMPAIVPYATRRMDPYQRAAASMLERLQVDVGLGGPVPENVNEFMDAPYRTLSILGETYDAIPPAQDFLGRPITKDQEREGGANRLPWYTNRGPSTLRSDPLVDEVIRMGIDVQEPPKKLKGTDTPIPGWQRFDMIARSRQMAHELLVPVIQDPSWALMDDADKEDVIRKVVNTTWRAELSLWLEEARATGQISERAYQIHKHGRREGEQRAKGAQ